MYRSEPGAFCDIVLLSCTYVRYSSVVVVVSFSFSFSFSFFLRSSRDCILNLSLCNRGAFDDV
jgi:hypothetical protein